MRIAQQYRDRQCLRKTPPKLILKIKQYVFTCLMEAKHPLIINLIKVVREAYKDGHDEQRCEIRATRNPNVHEAIMLASDGISEKKIY